MAGETPSGALPVPEPAPLPQLLTTKLHLPLARSNLLPRPQLIARLQAGLQSKLTLISAPAGFGKTTLLASWLQEVQSAKRKAQNAAGDGAVLQRPSAPTLQHLAWLSLDAADSEPARFWSYVVAALGTLQPGYDQAAAALLQTHRPPPIEAVLTPLLNGLSALPADAVLVLDDYHLIESTAIHRALAFLIEHLPPRLHLVLTTRVDPPLPLSRLRAQGLLTELRAADLRFTAQETAAFLTDLMGLQLSAEQIAGLEDRTEGWIAGLQFAALAMRDRDDLTGFVQAFRGSNRFVVDYLVEEVLARQPPHLQAFLLQTSILDRMCGPLCDAMLLGPDDASTAEDAYSQVLLAELERSNLFLVPLDDERHWYRYHHLFADLLRQRLRSGASRAAIDALHDRASAWFASHGHGVEAIHHALACASWERAARLIEEYAWPMMFRGQFATMIDWFRTLPAAMMRVRPTLYVLYAVMLMHTSQPTAAEERLGEAEACLGPDTPEEVQRLVQGMAHTTRSTIGFYQGDLTRCIAHAEQALSLLPQEASIPRTAASGFAALAFLVSGDVGPAVERRMATAASVARTADNRFVVLRLRVLQARLQMMQGRLRAAAATLRAAAAVAPEPGGVQRLIGSEGYYFILGDLCREWNDLGAAEELLRSGMERALGEWTTNGLLLSWGAVALARLQQAQGDHAGAEATLEQFAALGRQRSFDPRVLAQVATMGARLALARGDLAAAARWAAASGPRPGEAPAYEREAEQLTLARVLIAGGVDAALEAPAQAHGMLAQLLAAAEAGGRSGSVVEILILQALALWAAGDVPFALATLERALACAEPEGYVRSFVDEGPPMAALLREYITGNGPYQRYAEELLAVFQAPGAPLSLASTPAPTAELRLPISGLIEPLSVREIEILQLIAAGHSNQAIADTLIIAVGTVKKHINNIFSKLDVQSRTQALARAREIGLI